MKQNTLEKIKNSKPFEKHDVLVYVVLALFVAVLFFSFVIFPKNSNANAFVVARNNQTILTYSFSDNSLNIEQGFSNFVEVNEQDNYLYIKIINDKDDKKFNLIKVDKLYKTVDVIDANCSSSKECVHMPKIDGSGAIYCAPHALHITCGFIPPTVG